MNNRWILNSSRIAGCDQMTPRTGGTISGPSFSLSLFLPAFFFSLLLRCVGADWLTSWFYLHAVALRWKCKYQGIRIAGSETKTLQSEFLFLPFCGVSWFGGLFHPDASPSSILCPLWRLCLPSALFEMLSSSGFDSWKWDLLWFTFSSFQFKRSSYYI